MRNTVKGFLPSLLLIYSIICKYFPLPNYHDHIPKRIVCAIHGRSECLSKIQLEEREQHRTEHPRVVSRIVRIETQSSDHANSRDQTMATMLTASSSPRLTPPTCQSDSVPGFLSPSLRRENKSRIGNSSNSKGASPIVKPHPAHVSTSSLTSPSQPQSFVSAHAQSSPSQTYYTSSSSVFRSQCSSPTESRSYLPSVRSVSTQTSFSPIRTISRPSISTSRPEVVMVDAHTQYSPPLTSSLTSGHNSAAAQHRQQSTPSNSLTQTPTSNLAHLHLTKSGSFTPPQASTPSVSHKRPYDPIIDAAMPAAPPGQATADADLKKEQGHHQGRTEESSAHRSHSSSKRDHSTTIADAHPSPKAFTQNGTYHDSGPSTTPADALNAPAKKPRPADPEVKIMPLQYELCDTRDLVILISSMLMELIRYNDTIPLSSGSDQSPSASNLTRFHSRAPPGISVVDYLQRLTTYATLSPPILLSMVYYIDRLASFYPAFTISSLTVHRFLITAATVASKGLSDSFWTNKTYAKVGGVSVKELALLELEFLVRVQWRIVPRPETLVDYYRSLVGRSLGYRVEGDEDNSSDEAQEERDSQE